MNIYDNLIVAPTNDKNLVTIKAGDIGKDKGAISMTVPIEFAAYIRGLQNIRNNTPKMYLPK